MKEFHLMSERASGRRHLRGSEHVFPPTAEETEMCPPHYWILERGAQWCRKCGEQRQIETDRSGPLGGVISKIVAERGVGYLKDSTGREYFFNKSGVLENGFGELTLGQQIEFEVGHGSQLGGRALNVRIIEAKVAAK
jgi:cold shock CspA family protein